MSREPALSGLGVRFDDEEPVTVVLVRHGQTELTVSRGYSGSGEPGPPLDETGRQQARDAAALVDRIGRDLWGDVPYPDLVIASPLVRARQTGEFPEADFGERVRARAGPPPGTGVGRGPWWW